MNRVAQKLIEICPVPVAALLLLARQLCGHVALPAPDVAQICAATKTSRSSAYELLDVLVALLPTLVPVRGRPTKPPPASTDESGTLTHAVLAYVMGHPACVQRGPVRQHYSDGFRRFVVELRAEHATLGDGPERARLEKLAREWQIDVRFLGNTPRREALAWIGAADELVHASIAEGISTVVREAEHLGVKVTVL